MSGVTGSQQVDRRDVGEILSRYEEEVLRKFPDYVGYEISGSFNSDLTKNKFGDIDLIVHFNAVGSKQLEKKAFVKHVLSLPEDLIVPFESVKYKGRRHYNSGEIVTVSFPQPHGGTVQIDNIFALSESEMEYKQKFLNMDAQKQGLVLGLVKSATLQRSIVDIACDLRVPNLEYILNCTQYGLEYEFNISPVEIQLRQVLYAEKEYHNGEYKEVDRNIVWRSRDWNSLKAIIPEVDLNKSFMDLVEETDKRITDTRSRNRIAGMFKAMVSIKSGEVGTIKGHTKQKALSLIKEIFE